ncbi:LysR family transcriptional regulator [Rahnella bonaserana]|uniref:LysR family transcriptional regulator n=1 Tax=Rahnella bonaserana TaxID=2816248 RepID=UPI0024C42051|nr:LysR family transcriptional regulator [Rahnella bonaserana]WHZ40395.1 LysR family transcriptional regulator [Rahnella bonaserana]
MDRLDEMAIFVAVLQYGSLAEAARKFHRSPPAITRAIASLEHRFGARLVERTTRSLAPTEAGARLAEKARVLLSQYQDAVEDTAETQLSGLLRITAPVQFGRKHVAPLVMEFLAQHPDMQIEMMLNDRNLDLIDEGLDLAVRIGHQEDSGKVARKVAEVTRVLVASPAYLAQHGEPQHPSELAAHQTVMGTLRTQIREWRFGPHEDDLRVRLSPRLLTNDVESELLAVRSGQGIARLLSYQVSDDVQAGRMIRLLPDFEPLPLPVQLVAQQVQQMPRKVRTFWDYAYQRLSALPQLHALNASSEQ